MSSVSGSNNSEMTDQDESWGDWRPDSFQMPDSVQELSAGATGEDAVPAGDEEAAAESAEGAAPVLAEEAAPEFAEEAAPDAPPVDAASDPEPMVAAPSEAALDPAPMVEAPSTVADPGDPAAYGEAAPASSGRRVRLVRKTNVKS